MNKKRRKELWSLQEKLYRVMDAEKENVDLNSLQTELEDVQSDLESLYCEEESYRDNIPENLQNSDRYYVADEACDNLESAVDCLGDAISSDDFDDIVNSIEDAIKYIDDATV